MIRGNPASFRISRRQVLIGAGGFAAGLAASSASAGMLLRMDRTPSLSMLGSGSSFSLLIASGGARLIILAGSDPSDFGNALSRARVPFLDRTDIAIIASGETSAHFIRSALDRLQPERTWVVGSPNALLDANVPIDEPLRHRTTFELPRNLQLTLPVIPLTTTDEPGWAARLESAGGEVIISWGASHLPLGLPKQPAAWICLDEAPSTETLEAIQPATVVVPAAALSGPQLRELEATVTYQPFRGYRIHAGETTRFELDDLIR